MSKFKDLYQANAAGFTLIELLTTIAVFSLIISIGIPTLSSMIHNYQARTTMLQLHSAIHLTRDYAITQRALVTICPSKGEQCLPHWQTEEIMIFTDPNKNGQLDNDEKLLKIIPININGYINVRLSSRKQYLRYHPEGLARPIFGRITLCPKNQETYPPRQLIVNFVGRVRHNTPPRQSRDAQKILNENC
ncbi:GspH/FimT family pseudopilin [Spartinivicinus poritis]|uniref:Type II secretion system protein H n=1 Tax=Spartinivicinus poritis TaxID=2994640 RepID=A0ABT5U3I5_9GAMM|nr:GspH/FimT family pseudopilin [Spartinivicinus sp. A2-2]MDE1460531.1 GspH/FimT family pseudopilin [Spartinivicinus sp. A2-2]